MTRSRGRYSGPEAVENAINAAARRANRADPSRITANLVRQTYQDRLLCRIFSDDASEYVLKGGSGTLARVPNARHSTDIDISLSGDILESCLRDLRELAAIDLGDYFRFEYRDDSPIGGSESQPYTAGVRVRFDAYLGLKNLGVIQVDVSARLAPIGSVRLCVPANRLDLPRLKSYPYRLYPVADQIADKVCAMISGHGGRASSREKDLVDLVVLARTQRIDAAELRAAITSELRLRRMPLPRTIRPPESWGAHYSKMAQIVGPCAGYPTVAEAAGLVDALLAPILNDSISTGESWDPSQLAWTTPRK